MERFLFDVYAMLEINKRITLDEVMEVSNCTCQEVFALFSALLKEGVMKDDGDGVFVCTATEKEIDDSKRKHGLYIDLDFDSDDDFDESESVDSEDDSELLDEESLREFVSRLYDPQDDEEDDCEAEEDDDTIGWYPDDPIHVILKAESGQYVTFMAGTACTPREIMQIAVYRCAKEALAEMFLFPSQIDEFKRSSTCLDPEDSTFTLIDVLKFEEGRGVHTEGETMELTWDTPICAQISQQIKYHNELNLAPTFVPFVSLKI